MTTIYQTPFDPASKRWSGQSEPSGFGSLDEVRMLLGEPLHAGAHWLIYDGIFYGSVRMHIDRAVNPADTAPDNGSPINGKT